MSTSIYPTPAHPATAAPRRLRILVVGGGSAFMPGVIRGLLHRASDLADSEVVLYDISSQHVEVMAALGERMAAAAGARLTFSANPSLQAAMEGVDFVFTTFRPGGFEARHLDELLPLRLGLVGQETAGPGGFFMACRSVPVLLELARLRDELAPKAWIVNYTNPTSIVTAAVERYGSGRIVGMCDQSNVDAGRWARLLGLPEDELEVDWLGLNHATWAQRVRLRGEDISGLVRSRLDGLRPEAEEDELLARLAWLGRAFGLLVNSYLPYYFFHDEILAGLKAKPTTRAEDIMSLLPRLYSNFALEAGRDDPDPVAERGSRGRHGEFAINMICALAGDERRRVIANTTNHGAVSDLPADAIVELPCLVGAEGPQPLRMGALPAAVRGLIQAIEAYERLAAEAAVSGERRTALQALLAHPFVRSAGVAERLLSQGLDAHRQHLPQFWAG